MAAALSFYAAFSVGPLLIIVISIAGIFFGEDAARGEISRQITYLVGPDSAEMIEDIIKGASNKTTGIKAPVVSPPSAISPRASVCAPFAQRDACPVAGATNRSGVPPSGCPGFPAAPPPIPTSCNPAPSRPLRKTHPVAHAESCGVAAPDRLGDLAE